MKSITLDYIKTHAFEVTGLEEQVNPSSVSHMFTPAELASLPPSDEDNIQELKIRISNMIYEKQYSVAKFEVLTNLKRNSVIQALNRSSSKVSRLMLAKLVIGFGLGVDEADELFVLSGCGLQPERSRLDAVIVHCLQKQYDIGGFFDTCDQVKLNVKASE